MTVTTNTPEPGPVVYNLANYIASALRKISLDQEQILDIAYVQGKPQIVFDGHPWIEQIVVTRRRGFPAHLYKARNKLQPPVIYKAHAALGHYKVAYFPTDSREYRSYTLIDDRDWTDLITVDIVMKQNAFTGAEYLRSLPRGWIPVISGPAGMLMIKTGTNPGIRRHQADYLVINHSWNKTLRESFVGLFFRNVCEDIAEGRPYTTEPLDEDTTYNVISSYVTSDDNDPEVKAIVTKNSYIRMTYDVKHGPLISVMGFRLTFEEREQQDE